MLLDFLFLVDLRISALPLICLEVFIVFSRRFCVQHRFSCTALPRLVKEQALSVSVVERDGPSGVQVLLVKRPNTVRLIVFNSHSFASVYCAMAGVSSADTVPLPSLESPLDAFLATVPDHKSDNGASFSPCLY